MLLTARRGRNVLCPLCYGLEDVWSTQTVKFSKLFRQVAYGFLCMFCSVLQITSCVKIELETWIFWKSCWKSFCNFWCPNTLQKILCIYFQRSHGDFRNWTWLWQNAELNSGHLPSFSLSHSGSVVSAGGRSLRPTSVSHCCCSSHPFCPAGWHGASLLRKTYTPLWGMPSEKGTGSTELYCRQRSSPFSKDSRLGFNSVLYRTATSAVAAESPGKLLAVRSLLSTASPHGTPAAGLCSWYLH